ncbi:hypothetical protein [Cellulosimicrobium sp. SH8]|uniref:hypothetical protein n=1 Tax=Cellulosimicrobium sp. SH8 TaxID=2952936 RepID=UPI0021F2F336|nr:hypothetical protein [Cellulosimicrobium sp. SH8]
MMNPSRGPLALAGSLVRPSRPTPEPTTAQQAPAETYESFPRWPVVLLAAGAFVAIWGGWVDLGQMSGFGPVNLLPGIMDLTLNLAITLPLGMEVYAAFALGVWLTHRNIRPAARSFAGWSVLASLVIGAAGQITYHLLHAAGIERAPWQVVVGVACVPVAVMGMGAALSHLLGVRRPRPVAVESAGPVVAPAAAAPLVEPDARPDEAPSPTHEPDETAQVEPVAEPAEDEAVVVEPVNTSRVAQSSADLDPRTMSANQRDALILQLAREARSERDLAQRVPWSRSTVNRVLRKHDVVLNQPADQPQMQWATDRGETAVA